MKVLRINSINGIYNEMYDPFVYSFKNEVIVKDSFLDLNQSFWNYILSDESIRNVIKIARLSLFDYSLIPQIHCAINDYELFISNVNKAKTELCNRNISQKMFFKHLETLEILCYIYSKFMFGGIPFTTNEAFGINESSSKKLYYDSTSSLKNPLYNWLVDKIVPVITSYNPDIVIFDGKPNIFSFCIAKLIKNNSIHLCISNTDSEYYSLFKIRKYLVKNEYLFKLFNSVILKDFSVTENQIINAIDNNESLENIDNIIFKHNNSIICNRIKENGNFRIFINKELNSNSVINVHLLPNMKCYWNKCVFCGINKKYSFDNKENNYMDLYDNLHILKDYISKYNIKYIWFIDEAFPIEILEKIAAFFIEENIEVVWQARCRIEPELLTNGLADLLYKSGLRELRLGLESASIKILRLMNKFPSDFEISLIDNILTEYHNSGISIHFPIIIGFPGENAEDRRLTYEYLEFATNKYSDVTFNINILYIDISSKLFNCWLDYGIYEMKIPCPADEFLGNIAYSIPQIPISLQNEQDSIMKDLLYPWYPPNALLKPHIFYRLSETIRNTLLWKEKKLKNKTNSIRDNTVVLCKNISFFKRKDDEYIIYNWNSHRYIIVNNAFKKFLRNWETPKNIFDLTEIAKSEPVTGLGFKDYIDISQKLLDNGFLELVPEDISENTNNNTIKAYYNEMYSKKTYDYNLKLNSWIKNNINRIAKGTILEVGIGMGQNINLYLKNGFFVHGIDISDVAINNLQRKYSGENIEFVCDDIKNLLLTANKYSLIVCSMVLQYLSSSDIVRTIKKLKSSLIKNGVLYLKVLSTEDSLYKSDTNIVKHFFTRDEILSLVEDMRIVELTQMVSEDSIRNLDTNMWGTIECISVKV